MPNSPSPVGRIAATVLLVGAGAVHVAVVPQHLREDLLLGAFFLTAGLAQVGAAAVVAIRPRRAVLAGAAAGSAGLILLWLVSRTLGLPVGPQPWTPEAVGIRTPRACCWSSRGRWCWRASRCAARARAAAGPRAPRWPRRRSCCWWQALTPDRPSTGGHGLVGMRERARALGGTVATSPGPAGGFRVVARIPAGDPR